MKKLAITILAIAAVAANAQIKQTWSTDIDEPGTTYWGYSTAISPNGNLYTFSVSQGNITRLTAHDGLGNPLWSKSFDFMDSDNGGKLLADATGNVVLCYRDQAGFVHLAKIDGANGNSLWDKQMPTYGQQVDFAMDGQGNIVVLRESNAPYNGPAVEKFDSDGVLLQSKPSSLVTAGYAPKRLAVSANGQIYTISTKTIAGVFTQRLEALTPNLVTRFATSWNQGDYWGAALASDRNGRVCTAERKPDQINTLVVRTFGPTGIATVHETAIPNRQIYATEAEFDANGRFVVVNSGSTGPENFLETMWYAPTDTTSPQVQRASVVVPDSIGVTLRSLIADSFGQVYAFATVGGSVYDSTVYAFDENRTAPIWTQSCRPTLFSLSYPVFPAVGRWGQVGLGTQIGDENHELVGLNYVKQLGLRNLLINGQSFTGGRTITGTVNFYSNDTMDRAVAMTSNTSYATIAPTKTVVAGASQANISVDLKPTSVRRAVRIEGTFGGAKRSVVFYIEPPVASGLTLYPTTVKGGANVNGSARINGAAPTGGMVVNISSSDAAAVVPNSVTVPEGAITKAFVVNTNVVSQQKTVTLTATTGATSKTATLIVTP